MQLVSLLKAMLAMPTQEVWMRTLERPLRDDDASAPVDASTHTIRIVGVPLHQHVELVR